MKHSSPHTAFVVVSIFYVYAISRESYQVFRCDGNSVSITHIMNVIVAVVDYRSSYSRANLVSIICLGVCRGCPVVRSCVTMSSIIYC